MAVPVGIVRGSSDPCVNRLVVILTLIDMVGMGNGPRGRRRRVFRLLPVAFKFISAHSSSAKRKKETYTAQEISAIFLLSSHVQSCFCFYIRPTFLSPLQCIALLMYFSSSVFSSLFIASNM